MRANMADILSDLETLGTEQAFRKKFDRTFASLGFDSYTYVNVDAELIEEAALKNHVPNLICLTNLPTNWVSRYAEEKYADTDPIIKECAGSRLPIRWTESYRANSLERAEVRMMEDAWENGLKRGVTIPVHGPKGELGIFSFNSALNDREFFRVTDTVLYDTQIIAYHFHDAVQRTLKPAYQIPLPIALTEREVEILRWTAEGKTAWEIGSILKISERTVNFHIRNIMEKFGVHNKTHAAAKAMGLGLLPL